MNSAHWDLVYGRPPLSRDAILFGVALALHLPLLLLQFKAPMKTKTIDPSLTVIDMRDVAINQILAKGMLLPPKVPGAAMGKRVDLSFLAHKTPTAPPSLTPNVAKLNVGINRALPSTIPPKLTAEIPASLQAGPHLAALPSGDPVVKDKGKFVLAPNTLQSLAGGGRPSLAVSKTKTIRLPTGAIAQAESGIKSPTPLTGKILLSSLSTTGPVVPQSAIKVDKHAGTAISVGPPGNEVDEEIPVIRAQPRTLTAEQRAKELFPIHGALKDRAVDRQEIPDYPEWARKKGIESSVKFKFSVTADGRVKENIEIIQGSGYPELDELARTALLRWMFARLPPEKGNIVQDGVIEFRFSIK